ncbi:O-antigen ligase [Thioalkalivibrio sp. ALMg9]|uniref:O-antigen ligase family protein n=1 Tax=Thioalkalivibrio sp. ALMg9 TaxID=1266912 RepID=UPI0018CA8F0B|nr:O-antigen ligase family protein [Thioalkalivibrio sp. ALMg9]
MIYDRLRHILAILSFVVIISWITYKRPQWVRYLFILMAPVAVFAALFSLYQLHEGGAFVSRRIYNVLSYRENPNSAAVPFAFMGVGAFYFMVKGRSWWIVSLSLLTLVVCSWFLFQAQSRAALLYLAIGVFTILLMWRSWLALVLALGFSALFLIYINFGGVLDRSFLERGGSGRLEIWMAVLDRFLQAPIFGEGVGNPIEITVPGFGEFHSPHNLWLSIVLAGGAVGLVLFLAFVSSVLINARLMRGRMPGVTLVVGWLIAGLALLSFDGHGLVVRMNPHYWLGLWLPVGVIIGRELRLRESGKDEIRSLAKRCLNTDATVGRRDGD